jgi:hypothetical protein
VTGYFLFASGFEGFEAELPLWAFLASTTANRTAVGDARGEPMASSGLEVFDRAARAGAPGIRKIEGLIRDDGDNGPELRPFGCKVVGHGVEVGGAVYCCAHCAEHRHGVKDRA